MKINKVVKKKFAILPVHLDDGTVVFFKRYKEIHITVDGKSWTIKARLEDNEVEVNIKGTKYHVSRGK